MNEREIHIFHHSWTNWIWKICSINEVNQSEFSHTHTRTHRKIVLGVEVLVQLWLIVLIRINHQNDVRREREKTERNTKCCDQIHWRWMAAVFYLAAWSQTLTTITYFYILSFLIRNRTINNWLMEFQIIYHHFTVCEWMYRVSGHKYKLVRRHYLLMIFCFCFVFYPSYFHVTFAM